MKRTPRRVFTQEFKTEAVKLSAQLQVTKERALFF